MRMQQAVSRMLRLSPPILLSSFVSSCQTVPGSCSALALPEYDKPFMDSFNAQSLAIPEGTPVAVYILDAKRLRDAVRACKG